MRSLAAWPERQAASGLKPQFHRAQPVHRFRHQRVLGRPVWRQVRHRKPQIRPGVGPSTAHLEALPLDPPDAVTGTCLAWIWATCPDDRLRNGPRSLEHARRSCERTEFREPGFLDKLAAAHAECGDFAQATYWEQRVLELLPEEEHEEYWARLELYEMGRPYGRGSRHGPKSHREERQAQPTEMPNPRRYDVARIRPPLPLRYVAASAGAVAEPNAKGKTP